MLVPHNLLLLDEPSNHLDLTTLKVRLDFLCVCVFVCLYVCVCIHFTCHLHCTTIFLQDGSSQYCIFCSPLYPVHGQVLTAALRKFEGSVVVISHDRRFLEELEPTHVVTVRNGKVNIIDILYSLTAVSIIL